MLTKDFESEFDDLLPGMFANRNVYDAKLLNEAMKVHLVVKSFVNTKFIYYLTDNCLIQGTEANEKVLYQIICQRSEEV